jgi:hypothetical protein
MGNAAALVLWGAKSEGNKGERDRLVCWAHGQISYALGEGGEGPGLGGHWGLHAWCRVC